MANSTQILLRYWYEDCLDDCRQHKHRSTLRCRVSRSSHSCDAGRSMDSYRGTFVPIVDERASELKRKDDTVVIIASGRFNLGLMTSNYGTVNRSK
jgi:hypothetical protein